MPRTPQPSPARAPLHPFASNAWRDVRRIAIVVLLLAWPAAGAARADLRLPAVLGDDMVLQRNRAVPVWGWADGGTRITVHADWLESPVSVTAGADGRWSARLQTPDAGGPHVVTVAGGGETITMRNVMVGEVWLCSGQSNMEWSVAATARGYADPEDYARLLRESGDPSLRLFTVPNTARPAPADDCEASWSMPSRQSVERFSAVGYHFGRMLRAELGVPVGLIDADWGGTVAEAWTSAETLRTMDDFASAVTEIETMGADPERWQAFRDTKFDEWWKKLDELAPPASAAPDANTSDWKATELPATWSGDLENFDGIAWFRRVVEVPAKLAGRPLVLELGPVDDMDTTYFNGVAVGRTGGPGRWNQARRYGIDGALVRAGRNEIAVRVYDTSGPGGINGDAAAMRLIAADGAGEAIPLAGPWRYRRAVDASRIPAWPQAPQSLNQNTPTVLYNGMIAPIAPYAIRGAIWYQGESNRTRAAQYRSLFPAMIADWRRTWGQGDFPFYFVQIAPFRYGRDTGQAAELRDAQRLTLATPNTGMAVTMDIGNPTDIHPLNKHEVGRRLALWALARSYDRSATVYSGPLYAGMSIEGDRVRLRFDHVGGGLVARGGPLSHFEVSGADGRFHPAEATIDGDTILVRSTTVIQPTAVRYGWDAAAEPNLFNREGLPASSFHTANGPAGGSG